MVLMLSKWTLVKVINLIRRHHCLRHRPFDHRLIDCINIDARGQMHGITKSGRCGTYTYRKKQVRDSDVGRLIMS